MARCWFKRPYGRPIPPKAAQLKRRLKVLQGELPPLEVMPVWRGIPGFLNWLLGR